MQRATSSVVAITSWGRIRVLIREGAVVACSLPPVSVAPRRPPILKGLVQRVQPFDQRAARVVARYLHALWRGRKAPTPRCRLPLTSPFTDAIWQQMTRIPFNRTLSYEQIARRAGRPRAARAAGSACGRNPIPVFVPCHRVLAAGGRLGGFSSGLPWKRALLDLEAGRGASR